MSLRRLLKRSGRFRRLNERNKLDFFRAKRETDGSVNQGITFEGGLLGRFGTDKGKATSITFLNRDQISSIESESKT